MRASALFALLSVAGLSPLASAEEAPTTSQAEPAQAEEEAQPSLTWSGRLFVRDTLAKTESGAWSNQQGVDSARVGLKYEHPQGVRAVIKIEAGSGKAELKDGYLRLDHDKGFRLQAGRFKKPISGMALASKWDLPSIERGILSSLSADGLDLPFAGGRADGVLLRYQLPLAFKSSLSLSGFQNDLHQVAPGSKDRYGQDLYLRASVKPARGLEFSSSFAMLGHVSDPDPDPSQSQVEYAKIGSLEVSYEQRWLQVWLEGFAGQSLFPRVVGQPTSGNFLAARGLVAPRFRPAVPRRLRPYVGASFFDPRGGEDSNTEIQGGVSLEFSKIWRVQLEASKVFAKGTLAAAERTEIRLQLGARFKE